MASLYSGQALIDLGKSLPGMVRSNKELEQKKADDEIRKKMIEEQLLASQLDRTFKSREEARKKSSYEKLAEIGNLMKPKQVPEEVMPEGVEGPPQPAHEEPGMQFTDAFKKSGAVSLYDQTGISKMYEDLTKPGPQDKKTLMGWDVRREDWSKIEAMPEGEEKDKAIESYLYKWAPSIGYGASEEAVTQTARKAGASKAAGIKAEKNEGKILPAGEAGRLGDFGASMKQLDELIIGINNPDAPQGPIAQLRKKNPLDWQAQAKQQLIAATQQLVGKALEGGVLRAEDEKKYKKILPQIGDTYESAVAKTDQLITMIDNSYKARRSALSDAMYDVSNFPESYRLSTETKNDSGTSIHPQSSEAEKWAREHPEDPRSKLILQRLGK